MKKLLGVLVAAVLVVGLSGTVMAQWGGPGMGPRWADQSGAPAGGPRQGFGPGRGRGPCGNQAQGGAAAPATAIDETRAKEIASEYVTKNLPGAQIEKMVKFERPRGTMYQAEVKGPQGELTYLRINPFGYVMAPRFGAGRAF
jgi:hypothetical protein